MFPHYLNIVSVFIYINRFVILFIFQIGKECGIVVSAPSKIIASCVSETHILFVLNIAF